MLAFAIDHPTPATFVLISGDRDFSYALSTLRLRRYRVVLITPPTAHVSLTAQASIRLHWNSDILDLSLNMSHNPAPKSTPKKDTTGSRVNFSSIAELRKYSKTPTPRDSVSKPRTGYNDPEQTLVMGEGSTRKRATPRRLEQRHSVPTIPADEDQYAGDTSTAFFATPFKLPYNNLSIPPSPDSRQASTSRQYTDRKGKSRESPTKIQTSKNASSKSYSDSPLSSPGADGYQDGYQTESCCSSPPPSSERGKYENDMRWEDRDQESPSEPCSPRSRASVLTESRGDASVTSSTCSTAKTAQLDGSAISVPFHFRPLVKQLQHYRTAAGIYIPLRKVCCEDLARKYKRVYENAGVEDFAEYVALAEQEGFVTLGGGDNPTPWIMLRQEWVNAKC